MADRRTVLVVALGLVLGWGCSDGDRSRVESGPRMLDVACGSAEDCPTQGNVRRGEGIVADAVAYHLGPGGGRLELQLQPESNGRDVTSTDVEVLVRGKGHVALSRGGSAVSVQVVDETPAWVTVPQPASGSAGTTPQKVTVEAADDASEVVLLDARFTTHLDVECSVSAPGRRRRWTH